MNEVKLLHPATFMLDGGAMFGIIPKLLWEKKISSDEYNRIAMSLRIVLIQKGDRNILIDTGIGNYHGEKFDSQFNVNGIDDHLPSVLEKYCHLSCDEITDIIITHLHFDHVGGLGSGDKNHTPIFKNATIHLHKKHFEYAQNPTDRDKGSFHSHFFMPLLDYYQKHNQLNLLDHEDGDIIQQLGIKFKVSFGHTPWMLHPIFENFIYMADLVPMGHHVNIPWVMGYDIEPGITTKYKKIFYDYIIENNLSMIFEHDIETWGGTLKIDEKGRYCLDKSFSSQALACEKIFSS